MDGNEFSNSSAVQHTKETAGLERLKFKAGDWSTTLTELSVKDIAANSGLSSFS